MKGIILKIRRELGISIPKTKDQSNQNIPPVEPVLPEQPLDTYVEKSPEERVSEIQDRIKELSELPNGSNESRGFELKQLRENLEKVL